MRRSRFLEASLARGGRSGSRDVLVQSEQNRCCGQPRSSTATELRVGNPRRSGAMHPSHSPQEAKKIAADASNCLTGFGRFVVDWAPISKCCIRQPARAAVLAREHEQMNGRFLVRRKLRTKLGAAAVV